MQPLRFKQEFFYLKQESSCLNQWYTSTEKERYFVLGERKYIQNDKGEYEPFAVFGTTIVPLSQLMAAAVRLQMEEEEKYHPDQPEKSKQIPKTWK